MTATPDPRLDMTTQYYLDMLDARDPLRRPGIIHIDPDDAEQLRAIYLACFDPGRFTARGDDYREPLDMWRARAVFVALREMST